MYVHVCTWNLDFSRDWLDEIDHVVWVLVFVREKDFSESNVQGEC